MNFSDMHIHLQDYKQNSATQVVEEALSAGVRRLVCVSSTESDWPRVRELAEKYPQTVTPAFGLHPWYAATAAAGWPERLRALLSAVPAAMVGECGLDGIKGIGETEERVFKTQILLAGALRRPLVIHAVKAVAVMEKFWPLLPARFVIHSFNGRAEHLRPILARGGYVSLSASILKNREAEKIVRLIPENRLLLETDGPYQAPVRGEEQKPVFLPVLLAQTAAWRQTEPARLAERIWANSEEFIHGGKQ